jgi:hypothetical protein
LGRSDVSDRMDNHVARINDFTSAIVKAAKDLLNTPKDRFESSFFIIECWILLFIIFDKKTCKESFIGFL